jgi:hypothetical protein
MIDVLVVQREPQVVLHDRPGEVDRGLDPLEVEVVLGLVGGAVAVERVRPVEEVEHALEVVASRLGDHLGETAGGAPVLGAGAGGHDLDLRDGVRVEVRHEGSGEGIDVAHAVDGGLEVALTGPVDVGVAVTVGVVDARRLGEHRLVVPAQHRKVVDELVAEGRGLGAALVEVDVALTSDDHYLLDELRCDLELDLQRLSDGDRDVSLEHGGVIGHVYPDLVSVAHGHQREEAGAVRPGELHLFREGPVFVRDRDGRSREGKLLLVDDDDPETAVFGQGRRRGRDQQNGEHREQ